VPPTQPVDMDDEDRLRRDVYGLLGRLLAAPPDEELLDRLARLEGDATEFGRAVRSLAALAATVSPEQAEEEFNALFIGISRGEVVPYGSFYLTGFLNEQPLADLRGSMTELAIARAEGVCEPEDHIASLCEMMRGLIDGSFGRPADLAAQQRFFNAHLAPWGERFFGDLEQAAAARLYRPVGAIGRHFLAIESQAFAMLD
jgi:TorA maturation chaperone TorD